MKTLDAQLLHVEAAKYVDTYVCGYTGFVTLSGVISEKGKNGDVTWESNLIVREHPTYYGMLVAIFLPTPTCAFVAPYKLTNKDGQNRYPVIG